MQKDVSSFTFSFWKPVNIGSWMSHSERKQCQHSCWAICFLFASPPASLHRSPTLQPTPLIFHWPFRKCLQIDSVTCLWRDDGAVGLLNKPSPFWRRLIRLIFLLLASALVFLPLQCEKKCHFSRGFHKNNVWAHTVTASSVFKLPLLKGVSSRVTPTPFIFRSSWR